MADDDLGGTAPGVLDRPPSDAPKRDPLAPSGVPMISQDVQERMLTGAEEFNRRLGESGRKSEEEHARLPPVPTVQGGQLGKVPPAPQHDIRENAVAWLGFATALGGIAGAMTKRSSMNALAAFSGTLDGLMAGDQKKFDDNFKTWEANARATQENNKAEVDGYRNILERAGLDDKQRANQLELWATQQRNGFMVEIARAAFKSGDFTTAAAAVDSVTDHATKGESAFDRLVEANARSRQMQQERLDYARQQRQEKTDEARSMVGDVLDDMASGKQAPLLTGIYGQNRLIAEQEAHRRGIDLARLQLQWRSAENLNRSLSSVQRANMFAYGDRFMRTAERLRDLSDQLNLQSMPGLNWANLQLLQNQTGPRAELATRYIQNVKNAQEELSQIVRAGYAPTNMSLEFAQGQIDPNMAVGNLQASIEEEQKVVSFTLNAFSSQGAGVMGPTSPNLYTGGNAPIVPAQPAPSFTGKTATNPQTGQKLRETTDGQWVP